MARLATERMLAAAGFLIWTVVGLPVLVRLGQGRPVPPAAWWLAFVVWGLAFARHSRPGVKDPPRVRVPLLAVESAAALVLLAYNVEAGPALLVVVAGQSASVLPARRALLWVLVQSGFLAAVLSARQPLVPTLLISGGFFSFQLFALGAGLLAQSERQARQELAVAHAELLATRELLAESSRAAERIRISRDLHDTLGHHLTALSLNLEVARHLAAGPAVEHVEQAHAVVRLLLAEVRDVVGALREERQVDLAPALLALARAIPEPRIHLSVPPDLHVPDAAMAHTLLRCVQEIVTNAVRHSGARNLWIELFAGPDGLRISARDDGHGVAQVQAGHGLVGMRERLEESGGRLEVRSHAGQGFELLAWIPQPAGS